MASAPVYQDIVENRAKTEKEMRAASGLAAGNVVTTAHIDKHSEPGVLYDLQQKEFSGSDFTAELTEYLSKMSAHRKDLDEYVHKVSVRADVILRAFDDHLSYVRSLEHRSGPKHGPAVPWTHWGTKR